MVSGADSSSFQSTPSTRRETVTPFSSVSSLLDFNPLPPHGGRLCVVLVFPPDCTFQSTPSTRRETVQPILHWVRQVNFNPLPPHGGRQAPDGADRRLHRISIHSLHTEGDAFVHGTVIAVSGISIHSLHTEGDNFWRKRKGCLTQFQSTPSTRRETRNYQDCESASGYFNPLPPHGGRQ